MKKYILIALIVIFSISSLKAQFFNISGINTDEFPWVSTVFVAKDENNEFIKDATIDQFAISENGIFVDQSNIKIECFESQEVPEMSVVLVVDRSGSMDLPFNTEKPEDTPWERVKNGVEAFLNTIQFVNRTRVALVSFNNDSKLECGFTDNPQEILDSLDVIEPTGGTKYTRPYIKDEYEFEGETKRESAKSLLKTRPDEIKRVVVFLTDGEPDSEPDTFTIVDSLNYYNISAYNISFLTNMHESLNQISQQTNGKAYVVEKKEDLEHIYSQIAIQAQKAYFCELSWLAKYPCYDSQRDRTSEITFKGISPFGYGEREYIIPPQYIPTRVWDNNTYSFGNPEVGPDYTVSKTLRLVIGSVDFNLNSLDITPIDQGFSLISITDTEGNDIPDNSTIVEGDTVLITVEFEQFGAKTLRTATLTLDGSPCLTSVDLVGGTTDIILESPNGGEVYTVCDDILVDWSGVEPGTQTHISYSNDDFQSDSNFIATSYSNQFDWNTLPEPGEYKVKLRVDPVSRYIFATNDLSSGRSHGSSLALSRDERFIYTVGNYNDTLQFGDTLVRNPGNQDAFLSKHNSAGNLIWINSLGGDGLDSASGVCVDDEDNVYITGATSDGAKFGNASVNVQYGGSVFFIAKTSPSGTSYVVRNIAASGFFVDFEAWGTKIRYDEPNERIIVQGSFKNNLDYRNGAVSYDFRNSGRFTAYYDKDLNLLNLFPGAVAGDFSSDEAVTADGKSTYKVETIFSDKNYGNIEVKHSGNGDAVINRFGQNEPSEDVSELSFTIEQPILNYSIGGPIVMDDTPINKTSSKNMEKFVINESILPIEIEEVTITGVNDTEFNLDKTFDGIVESGNDNARDITINFNPNSAGFKTAELNIKGVCADVITITLEGDGVCDLITESPIDFGATNVNLTVNRTIEQVFTNNNGDPVRITPTIVNDNDNEFEIVSINDDTGLVGASINVDPDESVKVELAFTPLSEGNKTAQLEFNPETNGCENVFSELVGTGANTDLSYAVVDFDRKRIQTVNYLNLEIVNSGSLPVELHDIYLDNTDAFQLELPTDKTVSTDSALVVRITFNPQADGIYSEPINIVINEGDAPISLNNVIGIGENPTAIGSLDCKGQSIQNVPKQVDLILTNNSSVSKTEVLSLTISNASNYTFLDGTKTMNNVAQIDENDNIIIPLDFNPTNAGPNQLDLTIESNTAIGNNQDAIVNDPVTEQIELECDVLQNSGPEQITFLGVLVCDEFDKVSSIINENLSSSITVESITLTPSTTDFKTNLPNGSFDIGPNSSQAFNVTFSPTMEGVQNAVLTVNFSDGTNKIFNISGTGKRIRYYTDNSSIELTPGLVNTLRVKAEVPELDYDINMMDISVNHNPNVTSFSVDNNMIIPPVSNNINWTWVVTNAPNNSQFKVFTGTADQAVDNLNNNIYDLFEIDYQLYLSSTETDNVRIATYFDNCPNPGYDDVQEVKISGVCALDKRLVNFGEEPVQLELTYDADLNMIRAEFTVIFDNVPAEFEILDISGNRVLTENLNSLSSGRYEATIEASSLSAGVYFVKYKTGSYQDMDKVLIVR
ncbi:MAG: VWA domain-containing protein [Chlorobiota bacterium]